ncbi:MAG: hypothetical protein A3F91_09535 [Flavobacteria bacterium RIFCSPLOWO2_12_FULL_35_11]|nr:MAG: hypothetical protein A3F91_09535 [Flavobacteria bacterium RIFCSPLOWO2_12_FULL_35_11]
MRNIVNQLQEILDSGKISEEEKNIFEKYILICNEFIEKGITPSDVLLETFEKIIKVFKPLVGAGREKS